MAICMTVRVGVTAFHAWPLVRYSCACTVVVGNTYDLKPETVRMRFNQVLNL